MMMMRRSSQADTKGMSMVSKACKRFYDVEDDDGDGDGDDDDDDVVNDVCDVDDDVDVDDVVDEDDDRLVVAHFSHLKFADDEYEEESERDKGSDHGIRGL